jgi:ABC-type lipoprotein export system ATPase subunit
VGQSGSGKTTLLSIMSGLLKPTSGVVMYKERQLYDLKPHQLSKHRNHEIGFVFQNFFLEPKFNVFENVCMPLLNNNKLTFKEIEYKVNNAIRLVGLSDRLNNLASDLSGGEKQRVAIARAIVSSPEVVFADEPTGNLDTLQGEQIMKILKNLNDSGITVVLVTHNKENTKSSKRKIELKDGKIISDEKIE